MKRYSRWLACVIFSAGPLAAHALEPYYGRDLAENENNLGNLNLKQELFEVLNSVHLVTKGAPDQIVSQCPAGKTCVQHRGLGYREARRKLFGSLFLVKARGQYALPDIYCGRLMTESEFPPNQGPGPDKIPANSIVNAEHSWPQSRFSGRFPEHLQKGDLHILFPSSARANSLRGNNPFGDVVTVKSRVCEPSALGFIARGSSLSHFLPPPDFRGNVARAVMYFSVRYQMPIDENQEEAIKRWNSSDPVDDLERARNDKIFAHQQNRNPFVDHPEWADAISDF